MTIKENFMAFAEKQQIPVMELKPEPPAPEHLCIRMQGEQKAFEGHALCMEEEGLFLFYTLLDVRVPKERRERLLAWLARTNYQLKTSAFYMEESTGELTVRVCQYLTGADWEKEELIGQLVSICGRTADGYYAELMKLIFA